MSPIPVSLQPGRAQTIVLGQAQCQVARHSISQGFLKKSSPQTVPGLPGSSDGKESTYNAGDLGLIPGLGISPRGGHGNLFQYSSQENSMDRGIWRGTVHGVAESDSTEWLNTAHTFRNASKILVSLFLPVSISSKKYIIFSDMFQGRQCH